VLLRSSTAAATQQHRPLARPVNVTQQNGMTIRLTLCERDAIACLFYIPVL